jgi:tripartite-type tricarboxylate transporter receptor subunit TctC
MGVAPLIRLEADPKIRIFSDLVIMATTGSVGYAQRLNHHIEAAVKGGVFKTFTAREATANISSRMELNMAHAGVGSITFTCGLLFNSIIDAKPTLVPFNGAAPAINALIGGQVDYMCDGSAMNSASHVQSGTIKAYTTDGERRISILPNVATSKEAGLPEFRVSAWNALFAPKGTSKPILDKLTDALDKALDDDTTRRRLLDLAAEIPDKARRGQQPLAEVVMSDVARWTRIIKAAGVSIQ